MNEFLCLFCLLLCCLVSCAMCCFACVLCVCSLFEYLSVCLYVIVGLRRLLFCCVVVRLVRCVVLFPCEIWNVCQYIILICCCYVVVLFACCVLCMC